MSSFPSILQLWLMLQWFFFLLSVQLKDWKNFNLLLRLFPFILKLHQLWSEGAHSSEPLSSFGRTLVVFDSFLAFRCKQIFCLPLAQAGSIWMVFYIIKHLAYLWRAYFEKGNGYNFQLSLPEELWIQQDFQLLSSLAKGKQVPSIKGSEITPSQPWAALRQHTAWQITHVGQWVKWSYECRDRGLDHWYE